MGNTQNPSLRFKKYIILLLLQKVNTVQWSQSLWDWRMFWNTP